MINLRWKLLVPAILLGILFFSGCGNQNKNERKSEATQKAKAKKKSVEKIVEEPTSESPEKDDKDR